MMKKKRRRFLQLVCYRKALLLFAVASIMLMVFLITVNYLDHLKAPTRSTVVRLRKADRLSQDIVGVGQLQADALNWTKHSAQWRADDNFYNLELSQKLLLNRDVPDTRHEHCRDKEYEFYSTRDNRVSVIISVYNEPVSTLLRTLISVINRTPSDLLQEIIVMDDFSDNEYSSILINHFAKVHVHRNAQRLGLIKSRNLGVALACGSFVAFLDSHCEVNVGWLEPLLHRVISNPGTITSPIMDIIDPQTFLYKPSSSKLKGGFDWSLRFKWIPRNEEEIQTTNDDTSPFISATILGGVFLISKAWFNELDRFNEGLVIYGGESLELSLKNWLCGGQIEVVPCSRIGHVFRKKSFSKSLSQGILANSRLIAENWMDEFKKFFYLERPQARDTTYVANVSATDALKDRMQCRKFNWYLQTIFPELKIPNNQHIAYGELKNDEKCLHLTGFGRIELKDCYLEDRITMWSLHNSTGLLSAHGAGCLTVEPDNVNVRMDFCKTHAASQKWARRGGYLIHTQTAKCLEQVRIATVALSICRNNAQSQLWNFAMEIENQSITGSK